MSQGSTRTPSLLIAVAFTLSATLAPIPGALAQTPTPPAGQEGDPAELRFVGGPLWRVGDQPLNLRVLVRNRGTEPLEGFRIIVGVGDRVLTRSALESTFEGQPVVSSSALPFSFPEEVPASGSTTVTIEESTGNFATFAGATEGGVYPATLTLQDASGTPLSSLQIPLTYYPEEPEVPLNIVALLPLNERPARAPSGAFLVPEEGPPILATAIADLGWLTGYLDALERFTQPVATEQPTRRTRRRAQPPPPEPLHLAVGVSPLMLEELVAMSRGFTTTEDDRIGLNDEPVERAQEAVSRLGVLLERPTIQGALLPYSFPDLPTIVDRLPVADLLAQFKSARDTLDEALGSEDGGEWLFPPAGRLDAPSLQQIQLADPSGDNVFVSHDSIAPSEPPAPVGCPEASPSFTCPIALSTAEGRSDGFMSDPGLAARLARLQTAGNDRLTLQRFFAETSMIHAELPGTPDRVIQATIPSLWHPSPRMSRLVLRGMRDAPWLESLTPSEALARSAPAAREIIAEARPLAAQPGSLFFASTEDATAVIDAYETVVPPDNLRLARLRKNLLVAQSRTLWRDPSEALDYATDTRGEAESEMGKIGLQGADDFTCTSRDCQLQLVLTNDATYPVNVALQLISPNLELDATDLVGVYEPGTEPLTIEARARGSGVFRLAVRLVTTNDAYLIEEKTIVIRSTNFNRVALIVTLGALAFLIAFYLVRWARRRGGKEPGAA